MKRYLTPEEDFHIDYIGKQEPTQAIKKFAVK
jgi:hypothetical protein